MTTVTRREYSSRTASSNDGPQNASEFFQSSLPVGAPEWFGERTEDGTFQTRTLEQVRGLPLNQQSIANSAWTHRGTTGQSSENITSQRRITSEPQVRIYETPGVKQAQNVVLPDFQISIEAGPGSRTGTRLKHPIVTVTPAEDHDTVNTLTLVGPSSWQHTQHQQHVKECQGHVLDSANDHHGYTVDSLDSVPVSTYEYYEPTEIQINRPEQRQQQQGDWQQTTSRDYHYQSTPVEVTWHEPSLVEIHRPVESQGHFVQGQPSHVDNITVSVGERSHFTASKSDRDHYNIPSQPHPQQPYHNSPQHHDVTPVEDIYQNVYQTNHFPQQNSYNNFDQRSRPAPVTYGQPYQQKPIVNYQPPQPLSPPTAQYSYQPSHNDVSVYHAPSSGEIRYQQPPSSGGYMYQQPQKGYQAGRPGNDEIYQSPITTVKIANKLPLNPHFKQENHPTDNEHTLNGQQDKHFFQQQDHLPYEYDASEERPQERPQDMPQAREPMSYNMAIGQARYEGRSQPITAHNTWSQQCAPEQIVTDDVSPVRAGYMIPQQVAPHITAAPPPAPPPPPPANPCK